MKEERVSFNLEKVPAVLHSCELHGKRAKKTTGNNDGKPPAREKKIALTLDVSDDKFRRMLDECWPGSDLLVKAMSGENAPAQDLVSRKKMADVRIRVVAVDGKTEVFAIATARSLGRPTLRIGESAKKVQLSMRVVGPIASDNLRQIDDHCEADVYVDVGVAQTDIDDHIDGESVDAAADSPHAVTPPKRTARRGGKTHVHVDDGHMALVSLDAEA
jgi:hypothetical protein